MDKMADFLSEIRGKIPKALAAFQIPAYSEIPEKLKNTPLWVKELPLLRMLTYAINGRQ